MAATLSFRATNEFVTETKIMANVIRMNSSDYLREAVREKNERIMKERMIFLSKQLSVRHLAENESMDASIGDGLV